jgi:predicted SprT family Zn-dependent metalloprotease
VLKFYTCKCGKNATIIEANKVQDKYWCAGCYLKIQKMSDVKKKHPTYEGEKIVTKIN